MSWLQNLRKQAGMTGRDVSVRAGISVQHYNFIENEKRRPSVDVAKRIATVLDFEWTRFFEEQESAHDGFAG